MFDGIGTGKTGNARYGKLIDCGIANFRSFLPIVVFIFSLMPHYRIIIGVKINFHMIYFFSQKEVHRTNVYSFCDQTTLPIITPLFRREKPSPLK
jgi:hypothetical protein